VFELLLSLEMLLLIALAAVWAVTGIAANGLKYAASRPPAHPLWRRTVRIGSMTGFLLVVLWGVNTAATWFLLGWDFVMDRVAVLLPLLALPSLLVAAALRGLNGDGSVTPERAAFIAASVHAMAAGALLTLYLVWFDIPSIPDLRESTLYLAALAAAAALLHLYHRRRALTIQSRGQRFRTMALRSAALVLSAFVLTAGGFLWSIERSRFPASMPMIHPETFEYGGGPVPAGAAASDNQDLHAHHAAVSAADGATVSVADLTGPRTGEPDARFKLVAQKKRIELPSGHTVEAWTFNGQVPGPQLVVREGDLVEVELINQDIDLGVTLHWHGVDVPNAEDGVPGLTQNAVMPGESHTYRFIVNETGTHWYHSHQTSSIQVAKGLFGAFIILSRDHREEADRGAADITVFSHDWETPDGTRTVLHVSGDDQQPRTIKTGTEVRLRLVNSASFTKLFSLHGTPFRVAAIDGWDIGGPEPVTGMRLKIAGGGRYDVTFTMPDHPVALALDGGRPEQVIKFSGDGHGTADIRPGGPVLDLLEYGAYAPAPIDASAAFDREFRMVLDQIYLGVYNGGSNTLWAINGEVFPHTPTFVVSEGDRVKMRIVNRSYSDHPMHLHGHHMVVLSRNGEPYKGSPLVLDTLPVEPGETWEVAWIADNPGIWMDHCHILEHAAWGMSMHLAYANVATPYRVGEATGNHPE
jgi:FtsP/CotA-like multicopper oxidase with cupredoxin domain